MPANGRPSRRSVALAGHAGDHGGALAGWESDDPAIRAAALGALERLGVLGDDLLMTAMADSDPAVRRRAAAIARRHPHVPLLSMLDDQHWSVVEVAAWACGEREDADDDVLNRLVELATDPNADPLVRESCVAALGAIGADRGLDAILAATTDRPVIRRRAVLALAPFLDPQHARAREVAAALERALTDRDWQVRQAAEDLTRHDE